MEQPDEIIERGVQQNPVQRDEMFLVELETHPNNAHPIPPVNNSGNVVVAEVEVANEPQKKEELKPRRSIRVANSRKNRFGINLPYPKMIKKSKSEFSDSE